MDGRSTGSDPEDPGSDPEDPGIVPKSDGVSLPSTTDIKTTTRLSSPSSKKRSRRSVLKRSVVSVPSGDGAVPPSDSWAWRKYGQKPIKGSPYPRGYYRCSSCKGCPARKQVERSRLDPTMLVISYAGEHNHPCPLPINRHHQHHRSSKLRSAETPTSDLEPAPPDSGPTGPTNPDAKFADLIADDASSLITLDDLYSLPDFGSTSSTTPPEADDGALLYGPVCSAGGDGAAAGVAMILADECERLLGDDRGCGGEEDSLFAGLGELPECSAVLRQGS